MCHLNESAKQNKDLALYNFVFSMPSDSLFSAEEIEHGLQNHGVTVSAKRIEKELKNWANRGELEQENRFYQLA